MSDKTYEVLEGQKYSGKHKVYSAGNQFPSSELIGSLEMALNGNEKHKIKAKIKEFKESAKKTNTKANK